VRRGAAFASGVLLVAASLAVTLAMVEIALRLSWSGYYEKHAEPYAQPHPTRGWANRPNARVVYGEAEFAITVVHDSRGYRSPEVPDAKTPGRTRVLVLGDSFAWGVGVENDQTFSARLQAAEPRLEVINAGVNGYGTSQQLRLLVEEGLALRPDVVLLAFFWNDVANSYKRPLPHYSLAGGRLRYTPPAVGAEQAPDRLAASGGRRLLGKSYAYRFASDRLKLLRYRLKTAFGMPLEEADFVRAEELEEAWALEHALLAELDRECRAHGARFAIAAIPEEIQVQPETPVIGLDPRDYEVQERLRRIGATAGIPVIDLLPALRDAHERERAPLYYEWDRHLNARGHELVAAALLRSLRQLGWI
jgi:lysophospholipase L1-like esterase